MPSTSQADVDAHHLLASREIASRPAAAPHAFIITAREK
jgi:hypothetical protein